jgi:hypothetical protein
MNNINIICYRYIDYQFSEIPYKVNILFVPFEKDNYISNQSLLGLHGNYVIDILNKKVSFNDKIEHIEPELSIPQDPVKQIPQVQVPVQLSTNNIDIDNFQPFIPAPPSNNNENLTDILDMIPDIIHLSEDISDIDIDTTDTDKLISHNFK